MLGKGLTLTRDLSRKTRALVSFQLLVTIDNKEMDCCRIIVNRDASARILIDQWIGVKR